MADDSAFDTANIDNVASNSTAGRDVLDLANTTTSTSSTIPGQQTEPPATATRTTRCRIDISAMTPEERLEFANSLPIIRDMMSTRTAWPDSVGVWVLDPADEQVEELKKYDVTDMEEYCRALEAVGATFYSDPTQHKGTRIVMGDIRGYVAQLEAEAEREREMERKGSAEQDSTQHPSSR
jgi:hypothetical protein